jgi:hypothetical protein
MTGDQRWFSSLSPVMTKEYITFGDNGKGRVLSVGTVKVSESVTHRCVALVKSLGFNLLSISSFLMSVLRSISKWELLVFWILEVMLCARSFPKVRYSEPNSLRVLALLVLWWLAFQWSFGNGIGD